MDMMRESSYHYYIRNARKYGKVFKVIILGFNYPLVRGYTFPWCLHLTFSNGQVWFGATPVIVVSDPELGRAINLRNPNRHEPVGPVTVMSPKQRIFDEEGILQTKKCAIPNQDFMSPTKQSACYACM